MRLATVIRNYVQHKRSLGMVYGMEEVVLRAFSKTAGNVDIANVSPTIVREFLDGRGPITQFWFRKYHLLRGLFQYAALRHFVDRSPLPTNMPRVQRTFQPYIYTSEDMERLFGALQLRAQATVRFLEPCTFRALLLLLYGTGLRIGEAVGLTVDDFDIQSRVLFIRETKFFKRRLVPLGSVVHQVLIRYLEQRVARSPAHLSSLPASMAGYHASLLRPLLSACAGKLVCFDLNLCAISQDSTIFGIPSQSRGSSHGTEKAKTSNVYCLVWQPTWATTTLLPHSII